MSGYILCQTKKAEHPYFITEYQHEYLFDRRAVLLFVS